MLRKFLPEFAKFALRKVIPLSWRHALHVRRIRQSVQREVAAATSESREPPVLVFQMGQVGSTSVHTSIAKSTVAAPVFHVHFLTEPGIAGNWRFETNGGTLSRVPRHLCVSQALRAHVLNDPDPRCRVITLVRDPVARQISLVFKAPRLMEASLQRKDGSVSPSKAARHLNEALRKPRTFEFAFGWFDRELRGALGIDVFAHPFDRESGWTIIRDGRTEVLVLQLERLTELLPTVVSDFLGAPAPIRLVRANVRAATPEAEGYQRTKEQICLDESSSLIYGSRFVRHFYTPADIEAMKRRWMCGSQK